MSPYENTIYAYILQQQLIGYNPTLKGINEATSFNHDMINRALNALLGEGLIIQKGISYAPTPFKKGWNIYTARTYVSIINFAQKDYHIVLDVATDCIDGKFEITRLHMNILHVKRDTWVTHTTDCPAVFIRELKWFIEYATKPLKKLITNN